MIFVPLLQENNGLSNSQYEILQRFMTYQIDMMCTFILGQLLSLQNKE
jgi:hypothetical protein